MKYFLYIFTYLLLGASCSSPSRPIDYGTELTATDSICLSIDEHTHYESKSIFQFEENGHEYLSFLNEKASYKVHIYDLDTKQVIKTIHLQKEGRNAMPSTNGCFPLSSKHFLITTWNGVFGIINEKGEVENKNSFWKDSVNFHKRLGFKIVGRFVKCGSKFGRWYDMVWMEKMTGRHNANPVRPLPYSKVKPVG